MENEAQNTMAMQIVIDHKRLVGSANEAYEEIKRIFGQAVTLHVEGDTNFGKAVDSIRRFEQQIDRLDQKIDNVSEGAEEMAVAVKEALPTKSLEEYTKELGEIIEKENKLNKIYEKRQRAAQKATSQEEFEEAVKAAEEAQLKLERVEKKKEALLKRVEAAQKGHSETVATEIKKGAEKAVKAVQEGGRGAANFNHLNIKVRASAEQIKSDIQKALDMKYTFEPALSITQLQKGIEDAFNKVSLEKFEQRFRKVFADGLLTAIRQASDQLPNAEGTKGRRRPGGVPPVSAVAQAQAAIALPAPIKEAAKEATTGGRRRRGGITPVEGIEVQKPVDLKVNSEFLRREIEQALAKVSFKKFEENFRETVARVSKPIDVPVNISVESFRQAIQVATEDKAKRLAKVRLEVHNPHLITSLWKAVDAFNNDKGIVQRPELKIGVNESHLLNEVAAAIRLVENSDLKLTIGADLVKVASEVKSVANQITANVKHNEGLAERLLDVDTGAWQRAREERKKIIERDSTKRMEEAAILRNTRVQTQSDASGLIEAYAPQLLAAHESIVSALNSTDKAIVDSALGMKDRVLRELNNLQFSKTLTLEEKKKAEVLAKHYEAAYITPLKNHADSLQSQLAQDERRRKYSQMERAKLEEAAYREDRRRTTIQERRVRKALEEEAYAMDSDRTRILNKASSERLIREAKADPSALLAELSPNLLRGHQTITTAMGSGDLDMVTYALKFKEGMVEGLHALQTDESVPLELRKKAAVLASHYERAFIAPLEGVHRELTRAAQKSVDEQRKASERARKEIETAAGRENAERERLARRAATRVTRFQAKTDPTPLFKEIAPQLMSAHQTIKSGLGATTSEDARIALMYKDEMMKGINALQANMSSLTPEMQRKVESLAIAYERAFITPLIKHAQKLESQERRAAEDAERKRDRRQQELEKVWDRADREEVKQQDKLAEFQRQQARRRAISAIKGDDPVGYVTSVNASLGGHVARMSAASEYERQYEGRPDIDLNELERLRKVAFKARQDFEKEINDLIEAYSIVGGSKEQRRLNETKIAQLKGIRETVGSRFGTPLNRLEQRTKDRDLARAEMDARAKLMQQEISQFASYLPDHRPEELRDPFLTAKKAYSSYTTAVRNFEKEHMALIAKRGTEEQASAMTAVKHARTKVELAAEELRWRALARAKEVSVPAMRPMVTGDDTGRGGIEFNFGAPRQRMAANEAYTHLTEGFRTQFGADFEALRALRDSQGKFGTNFQTLLKQMHAGTGDLLDDFLKLRNVSKDTWEAQIKPMKEALATLMKLDAEMDSVIRTNLAPAQRSGGAVGGYKQTLRNAFAMFGGIGLGYTAAYQIQHQVRQYMQYEQEIAGIQGVLGSRNPNDARMLATGIAESASRYGMDLIETARAARMLAQSGLEATDVMKELDLTLLAAKGMGMSIEQVEEMQIAIRAITEDNDRYNQSINWTLSVMEKISAVEAAYAVESKDLGDAIRTLSPVVEQYTQGMEGLNDAFDITLGMTTVIVERLRTTGTQASNALKMMFSRLARPEILSNLQEKYGLNVGDGEGDFLSLEKLIPELGARYAQLHRTDPIAARQFAVELSGGRQVNSIVAMLEDYVRVQQIATESSYAWASAQERAAIAQDTLYTSVNRLNTNFQLFVDNIMRSTLVGEGFMSMMKLMADGMGGVSGTGAGTLGLIGGILAGGTAAKGLHTAYVSMGRLAKTGSDAAKTLSIGSRALGGMARLFTPGGVLLAGLGLLAAGWGLVASKIGESEREANKYATRIKSLEELRVWESPQMQNFQQLTESTVQQGGLGLGTQQRAYQIISNAVTQGGPEMRELVTFAQEFGRKTDAEVSKFVKEHPEAVKRFREEFARVFIEQLPADARAGFTAIENEEKRVAKVFEAIGGAAFAANVQIARAIEEVRAATERMVNDGVAGMKRLDEASRQGWLQNLAGDIRDVLKGGSLQESFTVSRSNNTFARQVVSFREMLEDVEGLNQVVNTAQGLDFFTRYLRDRQGQTVNRGDAVQAFTEEVLREGSDLNRVLFDSVVRRLDPGNLSQLRSAADFEREEPLIDNLTRRITEGMTEMSGRVVAEMQKRVSSGAGIPGADALAGIDSLGRLVTGGDGSPLDVDADNAREALARFTDSLLKLTQDFYEQMSRMRFDEAFARQFGIGYSRNQTMMNVARSGLEQVGLDGAPGQFQVRNLLERTDFENRLANLAVLRAQRGKVGETEREQLERQIADAEQQLNDFGNKAISAIFGDGKHATAFKEQFEELVGQELDGSSFEGFWRSFFSEMYREGQQAEEGLRRQTTALENQRSIMASIHSIQEASLPLTATEAQRAALRRTQAWDLLAASKAEVDLEVRRGTLSEAQGIEKKEQLELQLVRMQELDKELEVLKAQSGLHSQIVSNMQATVTGVTASLTNLDLWGSIVNPQGSTPEEQARARAESIRQVFINTFDPLFRTISDRLMGSFTETLVQGMMENDRLVKLFGHGEFRLQQEVQIAEGFMTAGQTVGNTVGNAFIAAGDIVAHKVAVAAVTGEVPAGGSLPTTPGGGISGAVSGRNLNRQALTAGAGMMVGQIGGAMLGKGTATGQFGAMAGSVLGSLLMPGIGSAAGGLLGGWLGGMFGGKKEDEVVRTLESIERAQRDTITAVDRQTDTLVNPTSQYLNMPSTFNVPGYMPQFAGASGGSSTTTSYAVSVGDIILNGERVSNQEVETAVERGIERGLARALKGARTTQSRSTKKY